MSTTTDTVVCSTYFSIDNPWCTADGRWLPGAAVFLVVGGVVLVLCLYLRDTWRIVVALLAWYGTLMSFYYLPSIVAWDAILFADLVLYFLLFKDGAKGRPVTDDDLEDERQPQTARARSARAASAHGGSSRRLD